MESFEGLTVMGNLTTETINISITLIDELNELMISEELPGNQSELQVTRLWTGPTHSSEMQGKPIKGTLRSLHFKISRVQKHIYSSGNLQLVVQFW